MNSYLYPVLILRRNILTISVASLFKNESSRTEIYSRPFVSSDTMSNNKCIDLRELNWPSHKNLILEHLAVVEFYICIY